MHYTEPPRHGLLNPTATPFASQQFVNLPYPSYAISNHLVVLEGQKIPCYSRVIPTPHQKYPCVMGVDKRIIKAGNGVDLPKKGDVITMEYTGYLYDQTVIESKGQK